MSQARMPPYMVDLAVLRLDISFALEEQQLDDNLVSHICSPQQCRPAYVDDDNFLAMMDGSTYGLFLRVIGT
jgi:hypothetical protein